MAKKPDETTVHENNKSLVDAQKKYLMDQFGKLMEQEGEEIGGRIGGSEMGIRDRYVEISLYDQINHQLK